MLPNARNTFSSERATLTASRGDDLGVLRHSSSFHSAAGTQRRCTIAAVVPRRCKNDLRIQHAIDVADTTSARLVLLHLSEPEEYIERCARYDSSDAPLGASAAGNINHVVLSDSTELSIARHVDSIDADVILFAAKRWPAWKWLQRPFVPDSLLQSTSRPVWLTDINTLKHDGKFRCRRILCLVTLQPKDAAVVGYAASLAARTGAELVLLHVLPPVEDGLLGWRAALDHPTPASFAQERLDELASRMPVASRSMIATGDVNGSIGATAKNISADVVIVPYSASSALQGRLPNPAAVLRRVPCPVVLVPFAPRS